ncbi:MAG: hypothetical protein MUO26_14510 [Methanotrichaceae archaeon]|nr:hypothetical protein [Methanotrichaceae archaeon]
MPGCPGTSRGPIPDPMTDVSTGRKRLPAAPVDRLLVNLIRTGTLRLATIRGPA